MKDGIRTQSGQAIVELALILGLVVLLFMGLIQVGYWMSAKQAVVRAAGEAARVLSKTLNNELALTAVNKTMKGFDNTGSRTKVSITPEDSWNLRRVRGEFIEVEVTYTLPFSFSFFEVWLGANEAFSQVSSRATSRIECVPETGRRTCPPLEF